MNAKMKNDLFKQKRVKRLLPIGEFKNIVVRRAKDFSKEWVRTDGWSVACERKALLLNEAVERLMARESMYCPPSEAPEKP